MLVAFMAGNLLPRKSATPIFLLHLLLPLFTLLPVSNCSSSQSRILQSPPRSDSSPRNIQTFLPSGSSPSGYPTVPTPPTPSTITITQIPIIPSPIPAPSAADEGTSRTVIKAVVATAAGTFFFSGFFFFLLQKFRARRRESKPNTVIRPEDTPVTGGQGFKGVEVTVKGLIVDENALDVLYWRKLQGDNGTTGFSKEVLGEQDPSSKFDKGYQIQRIPLFSYKFPNTSSPNLPEFGETSDGVETSSDPNHPLPTGLPQPSPAIVKLAQPPPLQPPRQPPPPPPLPPQAVKKNRILPPPPPQPPRQLTPQPPLPPVAVKKNRILPPPPPRVAGSASSSKPPPAAAMDGQSTSNSATSSPGNELGQTKLKPLHWDKVMANADHSMVWDKIGGGSFQFDDDLMEALFGYVATNRKTADRDKSPSNSGDSKMTQIFLLEPRKSQNIAIVLRSLDVTRQEIIDALLQGHGLSGETLEKLAKITLTQEEESKIRQFSSAPSKLPEAESFLRQLLDAVPSPFHRLDAMLFRLTYDAEIFQLKQSLETLESSCKEVRSRGLFLKLLEAVLKAGNRMNAGTAKGNAQAFNLGALQKLSDVKSTDGKTTLLHFVVEEVVRSEGKRCVLNRDHSLGRTISGDGGLTGKEARERESLMLGLPVVGGLSVNFSNVKKAATIDHDACMAGCSSLGNKVAGIRELLGDSEGASAGGFVGEMKGFLEYAAEELKVVKEEVERVMELVKRTTEYYHAGSSKEKGSNPLQLFVIVKDFMEMVDQVCVDIASQLQKNWQPRANATAGKGSFPPETRVPVRFPNLPVRFLSDSARVSSSKDSDDDF